MDEYGHMGWVGHEEMNQGGGYSSMAGAAGLVGCKGRGLDGD